jgi:hypothetical protein
MIDLPRWNDEAAVTKQTELVKEELEAAAMDEEREFYFLPWHTHPGVPVSEICAYAERNAVEAAERGRVGQLADLLRPDNPMNRYPFVPGSPIRSLLSPTTWMLVADLLIGRHKRKPGRPKMTAEERRAMNPIHDADDMFPAIVDIVRRLYPKQTQADIRDRAMLIAARLTGVTKAETVKFHRSRAKNDRRRIK